MHKITLPLAACGIGCAALIFAGCNHRSRSDGAFVTQGTGAGISSNTFGAALPGSPPAGPQVTIHSPARGAYLPAGPVQVTAQVQGAIDSQVNGITAPVDPQGNVSATVDLVPGLNTVVVEAWDAAGLRTERHVEVLAGQFAPEDSELNQSAAVRLTDGAIDLLEPDIARKIEARRPAIIQQVLSGPAPQDTRLTSFRFGAVAAALDAVPGGVDLVLTIDALALGIEHSGRFLFFNRTNTGTVTAQRATLTAHLAVSLVQGQLQVQVTQAQTTLTGFAVPSWAQGQEADIRRAFTQAFSQQSAIEIQNELNQSVGSTPTTGTVTQTVLGKQLEANWRLTGIVFDDSGATSLYSARVRAPNPVAGQERRSLVTRTPVAVPGGAAAGWTGALSVHEDAVNQTLHAAWRAGSLRFVLDAQTWARLVPNATTQLNTDALVALAPELGPLLPPGVPLTIDVDGQLPPVVAIQPNAAHPVKVRTGALRTALKLPNPSTGALETLVEAVYSIEADVDVVVQQGQVRLAATGPITVRVDGVGQSLPQSEALLERMAQALAPQLLKSSLASLGGVALPAAQGFTIQNAQVAVQGDSLILVGTVAHAPAP